MSAPPGPVASVFPATGKCRAVSSGSGPVAPDSARRSRPSGPATVPQAIAPRHGLRHRANSLIDPRLAAVAANPPPGLREKSSRHTLSHNAWKRRPGSSFAFACKTVWSSRTRLDPVRLPPVVMPCPRSVSLPKSGPFPRPALPGVYGPTGLSATLPARPVPRGRPVGVCSPPSGLPVLPRLPSSMHASANTPAGTVRCLCRLSSQTVGGLPLLQRGRLPHCLSRGLLSVHSRSGLHVRQAAQRSPFPSCFSPCRYLHEPRRPLPTEATIVGWGPHPPGKRAFPRRTATPMLHTLCCA